MSTHSIFPKEELNQRLLNVRSQMVEANIDGDPIRVPVANNFVLSLSTTYSKMECQLISKWRKGIMN